MNSKRNIKNLKLGATSNIPLFLIIISLFIITTSVNLQVPLYTEYADNANFGNALTAIVFAAYIIGLIPILVFFSGISDQLGRKSVLLASLSFSFFATLCMIFIPTIEMLLLARVFQGISLGLCMGTCTAYLVKLYPEKAKHIPIFVALSSALGFGSGALFTTFVLFLYSSLTPISYWIVLFLTLLILLAVTFFAPTVTGKGGSILQLPLFSRETIMINFSIVLAWTVSGLIISILPSQLKQFGLQLWVGPSLFLVNGIGAFIQIFARKISGFRSLKIGLVLIPLGYMVIVLGAGTGFISLVLLGSALAGAACYGFTYLGGLSEIIRLSNNNESRMISGYFLFAYIGFGIPSILVGYLADIFGTLTTISYFAILIVGCSIILYVSIIKIENKNLIQLHRAKIKS
ncbi:MFS transporter [Heyndrickxia sporothermodurans]|nr:MFS transporter [Heyndrickxia sporothermodurans]